MRDLEEEVRPFLTPMMLGMGRLELDFDQQIALALWTTKTRVTFLYATQGTLPQDELDLLFKDKLPPYHSCILLAGAIGEEDMRVHHYELLREDTLAKEGTLTSFLLRFVVLQMAVLPHFVSERDLSDDARLFARSLWPPPFFRIPQPITWPPSNVLLDEDVDEFDLNFAKDIYTPPKPPKGSHPKPPES